MNEKTCCVTGHRDIPTDKMAHVRKQLEAEIEQAIADGFTCFISGMAEGADLLFAELVIAQKARHPELFLEAAIPYQNRIKAKNAEFVKCLEACNGIHVQQKDYSHDCFLNRNRYMVAQSGRVIAVYDGREQGGTLFTMRCAHTMGREVREIRI